MKLLTGLNYSTRMQYCSMHCHAKLHYVAAVMNSGLVLLKWCSAETSMGLVNPYLRV